MALPSAEFTTKSPLDHLWHLLYPSHVKESEPSLVKSTEPPSIVNQQPSSLFALIIGINKYKYQSDELPDLEGCVADAEAVKDYLQGALGVPPSRIKTLLNEHATHDGIIENLRALKDTDGKEGDPILIYYAGRSGTQDAPTDRTSFSDGEIQLLFPHDMYYDADKSMVNAISNHTIGILLEDLAKAKGDNITVILDCCYFDSFSRCNDGDANGSVHGFVHTSPYQDNRGRSGGTYIPDRFLRSGLGSHVLLTACGRGEEAKEKNERGSFTTALLATLSDAGADKITYTDLIQRLPILPAQNPQCKGIHRDRIVFDNKPPSRRRKLYAINKDYVMAAGAAHGITEGAIFEIYKDNHSHLTTTPLGMMKASPPGPFSTVLHFSLIDREFSIEDQAFALQIRAGKQEDLALYVPLDQKLITIFEAITTEMQVNAQRQLYMLSDEDLKQGKKPDLGVAFDNGRIVFDIKDPNVTIHGLHRMPLRVLPIIEDVSQVINAAAHYYSHLRRIGHSEEIQNDIEVEFTKLSEGGALGRKPDGPNLIEAGVVDLVVNEDDIYGMKITNHGDDPLYASVFYFDNSDFSIICYYQGPFAKGKPDPSIHPKGGILTVGYGLGGAQPFAYRLSDAQDINVGYVKVFLSNESLDLPSIPQPSIPQPSSFDSGYRGANRPKKPARVQWDTVLFTVVQRRYPNTILAKDSLDASVGTPKEAEAVQRWNPNLTGAFKEPEKGSLGPTVEVESDSSYLYAFANSGAQKRGGQSRSVALDTSHEDSRVSSTHSSRLDLGDPTPGKDIQRFLRLPYLLAERVLQTARDNQAFHLLGVSIARQALRLVLLLNAAVAEEGPTQEHLDERVRLRREIVELETEMRGWGGPNSGNQDERTRQVTKIKNQYDIFFAARFYYVPSQSTGGKFARLLEYRNNTTVFGELHKPPSPALELSDLRERLPSSSGRVRKLSSSTNSLFPVARVERLQQSGDLIDIDHAISHLQTALTVTEDHDVDKPNLLSNLGNALQLRFERMGDLADLEKSISCQREAIGLIPADHPDKSRRLSGHGVALQRRFERLGGLTDIDDAISNQKLAVELTPDRHPDKPRRLNNLGGALERRFECFGSLTDMEDAISSLQKAAELTLDGHPDKPRRLTNLGGALERRFKRFGSLADLGDAISSLRKAAKLMPNRHPDKPILFNNFGNALQSRFECIGSLTDMNDAISSLRKAINLTPEGHPDKPSRLHDLGRGFLARFRHRSVRSDLEDALSAFSTAAKSTSGPVMVRLKAARMWANVSEEHSISPLDAFGCAIDLLPRIAWLGLAVTNQQVLLADVKGVVRDAVAAAIKYKEYEMAVVWVEQGRSIVWQNLLALRSPVDDLRRAHPRLAERLQIIARRLEGSVSHNTLRAEGEAVSVEDPSRGYSKLAIEWDNLVDEIRELPNFEGFLKAKSFSQLAPAAHEGPVVILNVNDSQCDALVLIADGSNEGHVSVIDIPLERFSYDKSKKLFQKLTGLLASAGVFQKIERKNNKRETGIVGSQLDDEAKFKEILHLLWQDVVQPVIEGLAFQTESERPPRIWWCATGLLATLPIHAAGLYDTQEIGEKISDYVVSSYTPTLTAILELAEPVIREDFQVLMVAQAFAPDAPPIPKTEREVRIIHGLTAGVRRMSLMRENATEEQVREGMMESNWIHLACHSQQNPEVPMESGFLLHDKILTLSEIVKMSLPKADFAFVSTCETAIGDEKIAEESASLAAGMFLSGYRGVIATAWSIRDDDGPKIAEEVYSRIFKEGKPNRKEAAYALHEAMKRLRESGARCTAWVPFIHIGR